MIGSLLMLPFFTNYLNELNYTQISFYISFSYLMQIVFSLSIESYFGVKYTQLHESETEQKLFTGKVALLLIGFGLFLLLFISLFGNKLFGIVFTDQVQMSFWPYGFYSLLTAFFNSFFKTASMVLIYKKQATQFLIYNIINFILTVLITVLGLKMYPNSLLGPIFGRLFSGLIIFLLGFYIFYKNGTFKFNKTYVKDILYFSIPYCGFVLFTWVITQVDRYVLQNKITLQDLNTFDLAIKCFFGIMFIQNSLMAVIFPKVFEYWAKSKELKTTTETNRYFNVFNSLNILMICSFYILLPMVYPLIIKNKKFYESDVYIGILGTTYVTQGIISLYMATIMFTKRLNVLLKIYGLSAIIQIILLFVLTKYFGLIGAIYSGIAVKLIQILLSKLFTKSIFMYEYNFYKIELLPYSFIIINIIQYNLVNTYNLYFYIIQLLFYLIITYFLFKNEIFKTLINFKIIKPKSINS
jgi:O-antigen/teichoic acid export membrane protein